MKPSLLKVILVAGLLAGSLDIIAACANAYLNNPNSTPDKVLRFIASGVFGKQAFTGGSIMVAWGLLFHFIIATGFAALFVLAAQRFRFLRQNFVVSGLLYGLLAWLIMNRVVVPLSQTPPQPFAWEKAIIAMLILVCMVGVPIAWVTNKYYGKTG